MFAMQVVKQGYRKKKRRKKQQKNKFSPEACKKENYNNQIEMCNSTTITVIFPSINCQKILRERKERKKNKKRKGEGKNRQNNERKHFVKDQSRFENCS